MKNPSCSSYCSPLSLLVLRPITLPFRPETGTCCPLQLLIFDLYRQQLICSLILSINFTLFLCISTASSLVLDPETKAVAPTPLRLLRKQPNMSYRLDDSLLLSSAVQPGNQSGTSEQTLEVVFLFFFIFQGRDYCDWNSINDNNFYCLPSLLQACEVERLELASLKGHYPIKQRKMISLQTLSLSRFSSDNLDGFEQSLKEQPLELLVAKISFFLS